jgi:hypothetical protein
VLIVELVIDSISASVVGKEFKLLDGIIILESD